MRHKQSTRTHNWYAEFLKSFRYFIDRVTAGEITKYEFDSGSKTLEYYYLYHNQSYEYPTCNIELTDISLIDGVGPIARNAMMNINPSNHNIILTENLTTNDIILLDKRHVNITFTVTIACEDHAQVMNMHDMFVSQLPLNFSFYDYKYVNYIEVTDFVQGWDLQNDNILNIFEQSSASMRYTQEEEDKYNKREYIQRYFSSIINQPILEMTSCQKQTDKETQKHSLTVNFETMIEIPNVLRGKTLDVVNSINIVIDTNRQNDLPVMIDLPENIMENQNINAVINLTSDNFSTEGNKTIIEFESMYSITSASIWVVVDPLKQNSAKLFLPLKITPENVENTDTSGIKRYTVYSGESALTDLNLTNNSSIKLVSFKDE